MNLFEAYMTLCEGLKEEPEAPKGLSPFCLNGRWGFADAYGMVVIKPRFSYATPFHEGLATVFDDDGWGYIDTNGDAVYFEPYDLGRRVN